MAEERLNLELKKFLPYKINILGKRISDSLSMIYSTEFTISIAQWQVLVWLNTYENLYAKDLSAYTYMDKTQVSRLINQLEQRGLIQRRAGEQDQRTQRLALTQDGKALLNKIIPKAIEWENSLIESLSQTDYHNLMTAMEKLEKQLNKLNNKKVIK
ncbi:MAG: MarR family transcriptional regulator [Gammaproteobacteria bacterium]|nr:MAG: MarR family transcriptional regulator [Gammaproteobacteria bacterium]